MNPDWLSIIQDKLERWGIFIVKMLPNLLLAVVVLVAFVFIAKFIRRVTDKIVMSISKSDAISGLTSAILYTIILVIGIMIALNILKLDKAVTSLLAGVGIIGLALGFAFQDLTSNFISGTFIAFKRPFEVGHTVETNGFIGQIEDIQLRATKMKTFSGLHVIIPNKDIFQKPIINYTLTRRRRIEMEFFILNKLDPAEVISALNSALEKAEPALPFYDVECYFSAIEEPKIKLYISLWTTNVEPDAFFKARHSAIIIISRVLKEKGALS